MGFSTPVLFPRFLLSALPQCEMPHRVSTALGQDQDILASGYLSLEQSSPWFSLLENECHRAGPPQLLQQMAAIRNGITYPYLHEWLGLAGYYQLADGGDISLFFHFLETSSVSENQLRQWSQRNPEASRLIEEYLFFAFYHQWREYP
jgi:hypothetical protein